MCAITESTLQSLNIYTYVHVHPTCCFTGRLLATGPSAGLKYTRTTHKLRDVYKMWKKHDLMIDYSNPRFSVSFDFMECLQVFSIIICFFDLHSPRVPLNWNIFSNPRRLENTVLQSVHENSFQVEYPIDPIASRGFFSGGRGESEEIISRIVLENFSLMSKIKC